MSSTQDEVTEGNTNCLEGLRCPNEKCQSLGPYEIEVTTMLTVSDDGGGDTENHEWDDESACRCVECGFSGSVEHFRLDRDDDLPPDPEGMNDSRAEWAEEALQTFMTRTGTDREDALGDLLSDLMHWADRNGTDFKAALRTADAHYHEETLGEDNE